MDLNRFRSMTEAEKVNFKKRHMERLIEGKLRGPREQQKQTERVTKPSAMRSKRSKMNKPPKGLMKDTTTSAYGDAGKGRPDPFYTDKPKGMKTGGVCKGAGAAIKGTKFEGVF